MQGCFPHLTPWQPPQTPGHTWYSTGPKKCSLLGGCLGMSSRSPFMTLIYPTRSTSVDTHMSCLCRLASPEAALQGEEAGMSNQSSGSNDMCLSDQMFKKIILEKLGSVFAREVSVCWGDGKGGVNSNAVIPKSVLQISRSENSQTFSPGHFLVSTALLWILPQVWLH